MKKNLLSSLFVFTLMLVGLFLLAGCQIEADVAVAAGKAGIVYAVDPVSLKLFNAADAAPTTVSQRRLVADMRLFNAALPPRHCFGRQSRHRLCHGSR